MTSSALWSLLISATLALYTWPVVWPHLFLSSVQYLRFGLRCRLSHLSAGLHAASARSLFKRNCGCIKRSELDISCLASPVSLFMLRFVLLSGLSLLCMLPRPISVLHSHWMIAVPSIASRTCCLSITHTPGIPS